MTTSQTPFLAELAAGHNGPPISGPLRAYFQQRLRLRVFNFILSKFIEAQKDGLTKAGLARRIEKTPDLINRWLGASSNLTLDTISDLLLGIAAEELLPEAASPLKQRQHNYSHFDYLYADDLSNNRPQATNAEKSLNTAPWNNRPGSALEASILPPMAQTKRLAA
jgi:hypothetical protein